MPLLSVARDNDVMFCRDAIYRVSLDLSRLFGFIASLWIHRVSLDSSRLIGFIASLWIYHVSFNLSRLSFDSSRLFGFIASQRIKSRPRPYIKSHTMYHFHQNTFPVQWMYVVCYGGITHVETRFIASLWIYRIAT
jgi:hypothetical protein